MPLTMQQEETKKEVQKQEYSWRDFSMEEHIMGWLTSVIKRKPYQRIKIFKVSDNRLSYLVFRVNVFEKLDHTDPFSQSTIVFSSLVKCIESDDGVVFQKM